MMKSNNDKIILFINSNSAVQIDILLRNLRLTKNTDLVSVSKSSDQTKKEIFLFSLFGWNPEKKKIIYLDNKQLTAVKYKKIH